MAVKTKAPKELIKAATIATALDKVTGKILGFAVKSNSSNKYYQITFLTLEDGSHEFFCTCQSAEYGFHNCRPDEQGNKCCAHIQAIKEVLVAKAELEQASEAQSAVAEAEKIVTTQPMIAEQGVVEAPIFPQATPVEVKHIPIVSAPTFTNRENYALTSNAGFSLLKVS